MAIKVLLQPVEELDPIASADYKREVQFMQSIRHPHVLSFLGAGINTDNLAFLVTELMPNGTLRGKLLNHDITLPWQDRLRFVGDIAAGVRYLHEIGTVHRDLKVSQGPCDAQGPLSVAYMTVERKV